MPQRKRANCSISRGSGSTPSTPGERKQVFGIGFRTVLAGILLFPALALPESDPTSKTLAVLSSNFEAGSPEVQKKVLREIGLLRTDESIPFLASAAVNESLENDVRRDALKAMLATDGAKYKAVLEALKAAEIETGDVVFALLDIGDPRFSEIFVRRAVQKGIDSRGLRVAIVAALDLWNGDAESKPPFGLWKKTKASAELVEIASEASGSRKKRAVQALGWVRDAPSTKALIRFLDDPDAAGAAIVGLGNPGRDAAPALGRFLMRSKSPELRRMAIESLSRLKTKSADRALRAYRPRATAEERALIGGAAR